MNICFLYPNQQNYSETFIQYHKQYLAPKHTLTGGWRPFRDEAGTSIFRFPLSEPIRVLVKRGIPVLYPAFYDYFLGKHLRRIKPDVVLAEYGVTACGVLNACRRAGVPLVVHFHGFDAFEKETLRQYGVAYREVFAYAKAIIGVSRDMVEQLVRLRADRSKTHFVSCGVLTEKFNGARPENADKTVLAVGRFTAKKAPQLTIKAFELVLQQHPDAQLLMIGKGELWDDCQRMVQKAGLQGQIRLLGVKTPDEIQGYLRQARFFVQHSMFNSANNDSEGTPTSVLEASAAGLPVVSTRHAGIKDAVEHGVTGFLVEEGDYKTMAAHMNTLLQSSTLAGEMGRAARAKMIREYDMHMQIGKLKQLVEA